MEDSSSRIEAREMNREMNRRGEMERKKRN